MGDKLTPKQERFVHEYILTGNATESARRAGYSEKTAESIGFENLRKPKIRQAIEDAREEMMERTKIDQDYVLNGLSEVAERCMQRKPVMVFDKAQKCMVQATTDEGEGIWTFQANGANRALELLGKHLGMFTDKLEVSTQVDADEILRARERARKMENGEDLEPQ